MSEPHPKYWQVKAAELEFQLARQQLQARLNEQLQEEFRRRFDQQSEPLARRRQAVLTDAGLDPSKNWVLTDATQTITEQE